MSRIALSPASVSWAMFMVSRNPSKAPSVLPSASRSIIFLRPKTVAMFAAIAASAKKRGVGIGLFFGMVLVSYAVLLR